MAALGVVHLWKEWGLHVLVLLSFTLQVALLVLAELRRRIDSGVLRAFVWSAYMLADSVAIYAIGHLSVTSQAAEHQVIALWAPLLLVHLGGQDNITAYALEDNRLWLRHLQTLAVQATGAAYVTYVSLLQEPVIAGGGRRHRPWLRCAAALLFAAGIVKYGKRIWALVRANSNPNGKSYGDVALANPVAVPDARRLVQQGGGDPHAVRHVYPCLFLGGHTRGLLLVPSAPGWRSGSACSSISISTVVLGKMPLQQSPTSS
ncbi:unnamed protein product [Urochloa humidicola]